MAESMLIEYGGEEIDLVDEVLQLSTNRKISAWQKGREYQPSGKKRKGRYDEDLLLAAFGLASGPGKSCPGATAFCAADCYSITMEQNIRDVGRRMQINFELLKRAGEEELLLSFDGFLKAFVDRCDQYGVPRHLRIFRWQWAGDIYNHAHARAIAEATRRNPGVLATVYTRTYQPELNVVPELFDVDNLNVYLSVDPDNWRRALEVYSDHYDLLRLAFLGTDYHQGIKLAVQMADAGAPDIDVSALRVAELDMDDYMPHRHDGLIVCPEEFPYRRLRADGTRVHLGLAVPYRDTLLAEQERAAATGKPINLRNIRYRGACAACRACYGGGPQHVIFAKHKVLHHRPGSSASQHQQVLGASVEVQPATVGRKPRRATTAKDSREQPTPESLFDAAGISFDEPDEESQQG